MSGDESNLDGKNTGDNTSDAGDEKKFTQADVNSMMADYKRSLRAENEELRSKAAQFDEMQQSNKSELEKLQDAVSAAEKRATDAESVLARTRIQATHGISNEDAELFLTASDEESLTRQAEALAARLQSMRPVSNYSPREGHLVASPEPSDEEQFVGDLFGTSN